MAALLGLVLALPRLALAAETADASGSATTSPKGRSQAAGPAREPRQDTQASGAESDDAPSDEGSAEQGRSTGDPQTGTPDGATVAPPSEAQLAQARAEAGQRFQRGLAFYADGDYSLALIEFDRAYQLVPDYRVLYNIAQVSIQLGRFARAREALERYVREAAGQLPEERRISVERDMKMLADRTAFLKISVAPDGAEILVDDRSMGLSPLTEPLLLDAGEHRLVVRKTGFVAATRRLVLAGAEELPLNLELQPVVKTEEKVVIVERPKEVTPVAPLEDSGKDKRTGISPLIVGWSATGLLAGGAIVTGLLGLSAENSFNQAQSQPNPDVDLLDKYKAQRDTFFLVADVLTGTAVVAGGISLFLTLRGTGRSATVSSSKAVSAGASNGRPAVGATSTDAVPADGGASLSAQLQFGWSYVGVSGTF